MAPITATWRRGTRRGWVHFAESHRIRLVEAASGVDEDVQPTVALRDISDERVYRILIRDVEVAGVSLPAPALQLRQTSPAWEREERYPTATEAPSEPKPLAIAPPSVPPPPVTTATRPSKRRPSFH
jgi:hypothetical protein